MKSALGWVLLLVVIAGGAGSGLYYFHVSSQQHAYEMELAEIQRDFITNTSGLYVVGPDEYRREIGPHLTKYFRRIQKLAKEYPELYDVERERKVGEDKLNKGQMTEAQKLASNLSTIQIRADFTDQMENTLNSGADNLTLADMNEEGANMLMLQTRQSLGTTSLSMSSQAAQAVLRLF